MLVRQASGLWAGQANDTNSAFARGCGNRDNGVIGINGQSGY